MRRMQIVIVLSAAVLVSGCSQSQSSDSQQKSSVLRAPLAALTAQSLPTVKTAELKDLSDRSWGPVVQEGDHSYRAALAGPGTAVIPVRAWWGKSFRPAEGTVYDLEITYKDTATKPVVFLTHGGFAKYWGLGEVHRFGGTGDGQWKTAVVPVSWDLICRKNVPFQGLTDMTEFGLEADKDLPVESIRIQPASADSAARYARETRAWVAQAQTARRYGADQGQKQEPVLPDAMKDQAAVAYVRTYLSPLMQNAAPQQGEAGAPLKLRMARNESEPAAFAVYANGQDLKNVSFAVSPLKSEKGTLACNVDLRTVEYSAVAQGNRREGVSGYQMYPQRLWPMYSVDIARNQSHQFWIDVQTLGEKSTPGTYSGTVTISADGQKTSLPIEVEVLPVMLLTMQQAGLELGGCSGPVPAQDLQCLAAHNHTGMHVWFGGTQPQMRVIDNVIQFDWTYLNDWMQRATGFGMTHMMWFLGGDPYGFPDTINAERDFYRATASGNSQELRREYIAKLNENPDKVLPTVRPRYKKFIRELAQYAKANNWPARLIIHPFDEPGKWVQNHKWENPFHEVIGAGKWIKAHFEDACALIREAAEGYDNIETGGDMHHAEPTLVFLDDVDVFCTNAIHEDPQLPEKVRKAGVAFWQYSGTGANTPAHQGRYTFGFFFGAYNSRGSLIWAYDSTNRFDTSVSAAQWGYGWYTPFGTVFTPFMRGVREGFDDRRWIETYRKLVGEEKAQELLARIGGEAIAQRTRGGRDTVFDFFAEMKKTDQLNVWRDQVMQAVVEAGGEKR